MNTKTYLGMLSSFEIWKYCAEGVCLGELGLIGDFEIQFPEQTAAYILHRAFKFSNIIKEVGTQIGNENYSNFRPDRTRFKPEEVARIWDAVRTEIQNELGREYSEEHESQLVPGIEKLTIDRLIPISERAKRGLEGSSREKLEKELNKVKNGLTREKFLQGMRDIAFEYWQKQFGLYEGEEIAEKAELAVK